MWLAFWLCLRVLSTDKSLRIKVKVYKRVETHRKVNSFFKLIHFNLLLGCTNCVDEGSNLVNSRFSMPLTKLGSKQYYLGIFFKVRAGFPMKKIAIIEFICVLLLCNKRFEIAPRGK